MPINAVPDRLPYGVEQAERERQIIAEQRRSEMKLVAECEHDDMTILQAIAGSFDDHSTAYGVCKACSEWVVRSDFNNGVRESRPMTPAEVSRIEANEARRRRRDAE